MLSGIRHGQEMVSGIAVYIGHGIPAHEVGVHINRVDRIRDQDHIAGSEQVGDVAGVALGAVRDEDVRQIHLHAVSFIISSYGGSCSLVALFRTVAFEGLGGSHGVHAVMERLKDGLPKGLCHISDAEPDDLRAFFRVFFHIGGCPVGDLGEQIAFLEFQVILI